MVVNFKPDDNYTVDGVTTIPRTHDGESLAYISPEEALRLREMGGGVPPNDPSGQITKFGIPSFNAPSPLTTWQMGQRQRAADIARGLVPPPPAPAPPAPAPAPDPQTISPSPQVYYPPGVEDPYASPPPPPPYLSQPMPPGQEGQEQDLFWYKQNQDWVEENWEKNPAFEQWAQQPPSARPMDEPPQQQPALQLTIEDRNRAIIDIMTGNAAPREFTDPSGSILPAGGRYTAEDIAEQPAEIISEPELDDLTGVVADKALASTTIEQPERVDFPGITSTDRIEIENMNAAKLTAAEISPEISIEEAAILGSISADSLAEAQIQDLDVKATVQGQLESLYTSIVDGQPLPPWASGPVRVASQIMQQRGLGASSIAGAALVQAVQESAIPIAAADAQAYATIQLQNLSNKQATALQNALTYAQMDKLNQDARVKAAITNAQSFLQIDLANLTSEQSTEQINFQADAEEMFTDQAAENATRQFNATGKIQVDEFFADLGVRVDTRSTELAVANAQFNTDQTNAINQFNQQIINDRDKFEANLSTQIQQSNSVWRRSINTANNATQNEANRLNAQAILGLNEVGQANLWQAYRDDATFLIQTTEAALQRAHQVGILAQQQNFQADQYKEAANDAMFGQIGQLAGILIDNIFSG